MDKTQNLAEKLRERRKQLGLCQEYMSAKLNITQPAYSGIENEKIRFSPELILEIRSIKDFENFDGSHMEHMTNSDTPQVEVQPSHRQTLASKWPWGKVQLYVIVILAGAFVLNMVFENGIDFYLGFSGEPEVNKNITALIAVIYFVLGALFIRWLVFRKEI